MASIPGRLPLAIATLLVAGCAGSQTPTPQIIHVTTSAAVSPSPTYEPSLGGTEFREFDAHMVPVLQEVVAIGADIQADATAGDVRAAVADGEKASGLASKELKWLTDHPPSSCYADAHATWVELVGHYGRAGSLTAIYFGKAPDGNPQDLHDSFAELRAAGALFDPLTDDVLAARRKC